MIAASQANTAPTCEVTLTRLIVAPRDLVFRMWIEPEHMARWWGPEGFTNPVCELDVRPGGAIRIDMTAPDGTVYPMTGSFHEIERASRLVFTAEARDHNGTALLESHTVVSFADLGDKTRIMVEAKAVGLAPVAPQMLAGMEAGWSQSLTRLERLACHG